MEWWEEFFTGPWLDVQRAMAGEADTGEQVDRVVRALVGGDRKPETHHSSIRLYSFHELRELLTGAGFARCEGFDSTTLEPFGLGAGRLMLVATKG